jgi:hypothetical protein
MMKFYRAAATLCMALSLFVTSQTANAQALQCAPYARQISGIQLFGRAANWWDQAAGKYARGQEPKVGAVLAFASTRSMPAGHVAMVSRIVSDREVLLTHANWSYRGGIERDVRAIDVSPNNDWSDVRVWFAPIGNLGRRSNAALGFIYPEAPVAEAPVQMASAEALPSRLFTGR